QVVARRESRGLDHEDVGDVHARRPAHLVHALHDDVERVHQDRERYRDLQGDEHGAGAVAQQRRHDRTEVKVHIDSCYWLFRYTAGGMRPTRHAGYNPAASVATMASTIAQMTPIVSRCMSSW